MSINEQNADRFETVLEEIGREVCAHTISLIKELQEDSGEPIDGADESSFEAGGKRNFFVRTDLEGKFSSSQLFPGAGRTLRCKLRVVSPSGSTKYSGRMSTNKSKFSFNDLEVGRWTETFTLQMIKYRRTKFEFSLNTSPALPETLVEIEIVYSY